MSRMQIKEQAEQNKKSLNEIIVEYKAAKDLENQYKKEAKPLGDKIKQELADSGLDSFDTGVWVAKVTMIQNTEFDEEKAIEILKTNLKDQPALLASVVKTKEYIDNDALENIIYNGILDATALAPCTSLGSVTEKLTITKSKGVTKNEV